MTSCLSSCWLPQNRVHQGKRTPLMSSLAPDKGQDKQTNKTKQQWQETPRAEALSRDPHQTPQTTGPQCHLGCRRKKHFHLYFPKECKEIKLLTGNLMTAIKMKCSNLWPNNNSPVGNSWWRNTLSAVQKCSSGMWCLQEHVLQGVWNDPNALTGN